MTRMASQPVNLVLEGGGVKGIGLVGAISVLEEHGFTFVRVAGTSAGAIVGSLVAAGFTSMELHELMVTLDYTKFRDATGWEKVPLVKEADLWRHEGIYKGEYFHTWISNQLATKNKHTFADLRIDAGSAVPDNEQYRLVVMASDVSQGQLRRLPWDFEDPRHPRDGQRIADAVRASMSIPFFFRPFPLNVYSRRALGLRGRRHALEFPDRCFRPDRSDPRRPSRPSASSCRPDDGPTSSSTRSPVTSVWPWPCSAPCRAGATRCTSTTPPCWPAPCSSIPWGQRHRLRHHPSGPNRALPERQIGGGKMAGGVNG